MIVRASIGSPTVSSTTSYQASFAVRSACRAREFDACARREAATSARSSALPVAVDVRMRCATGPASDERMSATSSTTISSRRARTPSISASFEPKWYSRPPLDTPATPATASRVAARSPFSPSSVSYASRMRSRVPIAGVFSVAVISSEPCPILVSSTPFSGSSRRRAGRAVARGYCLKTETVLLYCTGWTV